MKKKIYILVMSLFTILSFSCSDKDNGVSDEEYNPDREMMTMFRKETNTGLTSDRYACAVSGTNDIQLYWYGINDCAGYHLKMIIQGQDFDNPLQVLKDTIVGPDVLDMKIEDLQYNTVYRFAIQTLSKKGDAYNSKWYGLGDGSHPSDYCQIQTLDRYAVPDVLWVENITKTSMRVYFNLDWDNSNSTFKDHFEEENGKFVMDEIKVQPSSDNAELPTQEFKLTDEDKQRGYIDVNDLTENCVYLVNGLNNKVARYWDRLYNTCMVRMKGDVGEPILIEHKCDPNDTIKRAVELDACRIDTILQNYMSDSKYAEGTTFLLEAGKTYYMNNTVTMSKGFTLRSNDPNKNAKLYLGVGLNAAGTDANSCNFSFGRNPLVGEMGGINVQSIIFKGIDFDCDKAYQYGEPGKNCGSGNYFINQYSGAMPFSLESFEVRDCTFKRMIRGWIRVQGPNRKLIDKFVVDNCVFSECGYYDKNGRGYAWIAGDGKNAKTNLFGNFSWTNCTFIDSPRHALLSENGNLAWAASIKWNINVSNNTFINFSSYSKDRLLFEMRYLPDNSTIKCQKNLFVLTRKDGDTRTLYQAGMDVRKFNGMVFDFADNYSTLRPDVAADKHKEDEAMTSYAFSATNRGAGFAGGSQNIQGAEQTKIHLGTVGIKPEDLMVNPFPKGKMGEENMHMFDLDGLYFKKTNDVLNHEIYKLNIGDPRWRK